MTNRVSGHKGSLLHKRIGAAYAKQELVSTTSDGRARANEYNLPDSTPTIENTSGYGQKYIEPVPIGVSELGVVEITLHWDSSANGLIDYLRDMYDRQHANDDPCATRVEDWLIAMPEGKCPGKHYAKYEGAIINKRAPQTPKDNVLMFGTGFRVWQPYEGRIETVDFDISVDDGTASPAPTAAGVENAIYDYFLLNIHANTDFTQTGFATYLGTVFPNVGAITWTTPSGATTSVSTAGNILIPGTISVTITSA